MKDSPYLEPCRLGDVIAAIQVLAYYKFYKLDVDKWAERITGDAADAASLETVFRDHPEFFQLTTDANGAKAALVARRSFTRSYDVDAAREISENEAVVRRLDPEAWGRLSRHPLTPEETAVLIRTATDMHSRALEQQKAGRWWVRPAIAGISFVGAIASAAVGALILATMSGGS